MGRQELHISWACATKPYLPTLQMGRHGHAKFSHSNLSYLGVNTGKIEGMRVNIDHSEGGTCNS